MSNVISVGELDQSILDIAENALVEGATKTGALIKGYAKALCDVFDVRGTNGELIAKWYDLRGKEAKGIKARRDSFVQKMIARGHVKEGTTDKPSATVDTYWSRVKAESGYVPSSKVSGSPDVDKTTAAELRTMINRILKTESEGKDCHASTILDTLKDAHVILTGEAFDAKK
jgi:hypothetical protein